MMKKRQNNSFSPPENCVECRKKYYKFSSILWDEKFKNIADIKWKDNGIIVITKILNILNGFKTQIEFILNKINSLESPTERKVSILNEYKGQPITQEDFNIFLNENSLFKPSEFKEEDFIFVGVDEFGNTYKIDGENISGKVKSVNNKIGDVILKTSDLENDSNYITTSHSNNKNNPHEVTKEQIGLGNVNNTSDLNKPVSTATQAELDKKLNKPVTNNTSDYVILADGSTELKTNFGKVKTVNENEPDENGNINIDLNYIPLTGTELNKPASGDIQTIGTFRITDTNNNARIAISDSYLERYVQEDVSQALGEVGSLLETFSPLEYRLEHITGVVNNTYSSDYNGMVITSNEDSDTQPTSSMYATVSQAGISHTNIDNKNQVTTYTLEVKESGIEAQENSLPFIASNPSDVITKQNLQNFNYDTNWGSPNQRMTALPDKSVDATYNLFMGMDSNGNIAKFENAYNLLHKSLSTMTQTQALTLGQLLNGGQGSAGAISVNLISPPVLMNLVSENTYVVLRGINLLLNSTAMGIEIIDASSNIVATIPNNQIQLNTNGLEIVFYYDFSTLPIGTYRLRIYSGVKVYVTTLELKIVSSVENIDINNMTWDIVRDSTLDVSKASIEYSGGTLVSNNTTANGSDSANIAFTVKSSKMFNIGEDFLIELIVDFNYGQNNSSNTFQTRFGVGYDSDLVNTYKQLSYVAFQRRNNASVGMSLNGVSVTSKFLPFTDNLTFIKQGNLLTTISETGVVRTMTISNNSDYCLWLSSIYRVTSETININILKAYKFNN